MTTEDEFQRMLDVEHPLDWMTRRVLSDFLRDRNDPRADGYLALSRPGWDYWTCAGFVADRSTSLTIKVQVWWACPAWYIKRGVPAPWFDRLNPTSLSGDRGRSWPSVSKLRDPSGVLKPFLRRALDDALASAFIQVPEPDRSKILADALIPYE